MTKEEKKRNQRKEEKRFAQHLFCGESLMSYGT